LEDWGIPTFNKKIRGQVHIAGAGSSVLSGMGNMIYLKFKALRPGGWLFMGGISGKSYLNEGSPVMTLNSTYIHVNSRPYPDIYYDNYELFVGEEAQMYVSGGTAPFIFSIVDTAVAVISNQSMVKAKGPGITKAFVTDKAGEKSYTTGNIDVRAIKMNIMRSSAWPKDTF